VDFCLVSRVCFIYENSRLKTSQTRSVTSMCTSSPHFMYVNIEEVYVYMLAVAFSRFLFNACAARQCHCQ
jgi:hypothetical protein